MNRLVESGQLGSGNTAWPRIIAHHPDPELVQVRLSHIANNGTDGGGTLGARLRELLRLANAQLVGCDACSQARYDSELAEEAIACAVVGAGEELSERERLALAFQRKMHLDHWSIDSETYRQLATVFTTAEIVELGDAIATGMGHGRWLHTLDMLSSGEPVVPWSHTPDAQSESDRELTSPL
ncbi:carboxymuconolactone decarboxylase family protein [Pseudonocardia oroxyli]|nr:carboxymuconolactone decarboxylase family protein [Pseudonocardia oroxyli]